MKEKIKRFTLLLLTLAFAGVFIICPTFAAASPDYSSVLATTKGNGVLSDSTDVGIWRGMIVDSNTGNISTGCRIASFDSETGVLTYSVQVGPGGYGYLLISGADVISCVASSRYITVSASSSAPVIANPVTSRYNAPYYVAQSVDLSSVPNDVVWISVHSTTNTSSTESTITITISVPEPDVYIDTLIPGTGSFVSSLFSVGTQLSNFIVNTPLVLIGFVLSIVYFCVLGIKKFF